METSFVAVLILTAAVGAGGTARAPVRPFERYADLTPNNQIDELVFAKLKALGIQPSYVCSDAVFVRRVYLDLLGTLPTASEARQFLLSRNPNRRSLLIDRLLERDEFADYWAMKWSDLLRVKSEFPIDLWPNAVQAYHRWIRTSIAENKPYDEFVRELLTSSGSNFRMPPVNFFRAAQQRDPEGLAQAVALTFMGVRTDQWPKGRLAGMAAFFDHVGYKATDEWKEEIVFFDIYGQSDDTPNDSPHSAIFPDGTRVTLSSDRDPRTVFADWLIRPDNPWFAGNIVNRVWYWLLGRGIIHEPDDIRPDNAPCNPELLAWLEKQLVEADYDLKHVYRLVLNSKTYQLSSVPRSEHPGGRQAAANFAYYPLRRLPAEVLIDALCQITGTREEYSSRTPEPYTFIPDQQRSIALADGSITSSFLEMFGRPSRDTGQESERHDSITAAQRLHLLNSSHVQKKIAQSPQLRSLARYRRSPREAVVMIYLTILSRFPTQDELDALWQYARSGDASGPEVIVDLAWALVNTSEFLYRH